MTRAELQARAELGHIHNFLFFFGHQPHPSRHLTKTCFSQWWQEPFTIDGIKYLTAEHWMMAAKARVFNDSVSLSKILECPTPSGAKALGRRVRGYDELTWQSVRYNLVVTGNLHKFSQNPELKAFLLATGDKVLVEASPYDKIWGIGLAETHVDAPRPDRWPGLNLLGSALMDVRKELRA